jgi:hypothetical protein
VLLIGRIGSNLGRKPKDAAADPGHLSKANLDTLIGQRQIGAYIAIGRGKHLRPG